MLSSKGTSTSANIEASSSSFSEEEAPVLLWLGLGLVMMVMFETTLVAALLLESQWMGKTHETERGAGKCRHCNKNELIVNKWWWVGV